MNANNSLPESPVDKNVFALVREVLASRHLTELQQQFIAYLLEHHQDATYCSQRGIAEHFRHSNMEAWNKLKTDVRAFVTRTRKRLEFHFADPDCGRSSPYRLVIAPGSPYCLQSVLNVPLTSLEQFWDIHFGSTAGNLLVTTEPVFFFDPVRKYFIRWLDINSAPEPDGATEQDSRTKGLVPCFSYTPTGEGSAQLLLAKLFQEQQKDLQIKASRTCNESELWNHDLILLGNRRTDRFIRELQSRYQFDLVQDNDLIRNTNKKGDETEVYKDFDALEGTGYTHALVTRCKGIFKHSVTIIAANHGRAAHMVAELLTSEQHLARMFAKIEVEPKTRLSNLFQILFQVKTWNFNTVASEPEPAVWREYPFQTGDG